VREYRALGLGGAFWLLEGPLFRESCKAFGLEGLWGFCENWMAPLVFLRPCSRGYCLELRDIQPSGLNVLGKIGMPL